jgi:hypothetical protein
MQSLLMKNSHLNFTDRIYIDFFSLKAGCSSWFRDHAVRVGGREFTKVTRELGWPEKIAVRGGLDWTTR